MRRAPVALLQVDCEPPSREMTAVVTDAENCGPTVPAGVHPQRLATPPPPQNWGAAHVVGQVIVVLQAVSVPHHDGSQAHPQRFGEPPPPQVCPFAQVPQLMGEPQPLSTWPQFAFACEHVRIRQPSGPASPREVHALYAVISGRHSALVSDVLTDPDDVHLVRYVWHSFMALKAAPHVESLSSLEHSVCAASDGTAPLAHAGTLEHTSAALVVVPPPLQPPRAVSVMSPVTPANTIQRPKRMSPSSG